MARLKAYRARLILFPRKPGQHKPGDASKEDVAAFEKRREEQAEEAGHHRDRHHHGGVHRLGAALPIVDEARLKAVTEVKASEMPEGEEGAYRRLRRARSDARLVGVREKRAKAKAEEAASQKK